LLTAALQGSWELGYCYSASVILADNSKYNIISDDLLKLYYINQFYVTHYKLKPLLITALLGREVIQLLPVMASESLSTTTISDPQQERN